MLKSSSDNTMITKMIKRELLQAGISGEQLVYVGGNIYQIKGVEGMVRIGEDES